MTHDAEALGPRALSAVGTRAWRLGVVVRLTIYRVEEFACLDCSGDYLAGCQKCNREGVLRFKLPWHHHGILSGHRMEAYWNSLHDGSVQSSAEWLPQNPIPDFSYDSTKGVLLGLARELHRDPTMSTSFSPMTGRWRCQGNKSDTFRGETEGESIVDALEAWQRMQPRE